MTLPDDAIKPPTLPSQSDEQRRKRKSLADLLDAINLVSPEGAMITRSETSDDGTTVTVRFWLRIDATTDICLTRTTKRDGAT